MRYEIKAGLGISDGVLDDTHSRRWSENDFGMKEYENDKVAYAHFT